MRIRIVLCRRLWKLIFSFRGVYVGNGNPVQCSCLENPRAGVAQSRTRPKRQQQQQCGFTSLTLVLIWAAFICGHFLMVSTLRVPFYYWCISKTLIPWRRKWQPSPVFLPGESRGWRSYMGYSPWGHRALDTTEWLHFLFIHSSFTAICPYMGIISRFNHKEFEGSRGRKRVSEESELPYKLFRWESGGGDSGPALLLTALFHAGHQIILCMWFFYFANKYFWSARCVLYMAANKMDKILDFMNHILYWRKISNEQINRLKKF